MVIILLILLILITILHCYFRGNSLIENLDNTSETVSSTDNTSTDETNDYKPYSELQENSKQGSMFLAMKNAANIAALHSQLAALKNVPSEIIDISGMVHQNSSALVNIGKEIHKVGAKRFNTDPTSNTTTDPTSNTSTKINSTITGKNITSNTSNNSKYNFPTTSW